MSAGILISDIRVLVNLERVGLVHTTFKLPYTIAIPDILYVREIKLHKPEYLELGLRVEALNNQEFSMALACQKKDYRFSTSEACALVLAKCRKYALLTDEPVFRSLAFSENVECIGMAWIFESLLNNKLINTKQIKDQLHPWEPRLARSTNN